MRASAIDAVSPGSLAHLMVLSPWRSHCDRLHTAHTVDERTRRLAADCVSLSMPLSMSIYIAHKRETSNV